MNDLAELPNVGPQLARELLAAGIESGARLRELGAAAAWERVRDVNPDRDCASSLLALEGAVRGVRWMSLDLAERRRLSEYAESRRRSR
jgi:DNA transformation protein